eukprot:scaffold15984_cov127-Skeletonema_dohrnii-CCMP3373.AAC.2
MIFVVPDRSMPDASSAIKTELLKMEIHKPLFLDTVICTTLSEPRSLESCDYRTFSCLGYLPAHDSYLIPSAFERFGSSKMHFSELAVLLKYEYHREA